jgi:hypothetical protein
MAEVNKQLLEQLIDCQESDLPSARIVQLMASEIMRMRGYGDMIPAPDIHLQQRSVRILKGIKQDKIVEDTFQRLAKLLEPKLHLDCFEVFRELLQYVTEDTPLTDDSDWIEIDTSILVESEKVVHDAIGFGGSHSHKVHNDAMVAVLKYIENSQGAYTTLVPISFLRQIYQAIDEIMYGKMYSQAARDKLKDTIYVLIEKHDQIHVADQGKPDASHKTDN